MKKEIPSFWLQDVDFDIKDVEIQIRQRKGLKPDSSFVSKPKDGVTIIWCGCELFKRYQWEFRKYEERNIKVSIHE